MGLEHLQMQQASKIVPSIKRHIKVQSQQAGLSFSITDNPQKWRSQLCLSSSWLFSTWSRLAAMNMVVASVQIKVERLFVQQRDRIVWIAILGTFVRADTTQNRSISMAHAHIVSRYKTVIAQWICLTVHVNCEWIVNLTLEWPSEWSESKLELDL